jgi:hypothetical protein
VFGVSLADSTKIQLVKVSLSLTKDFTAEAPYLDKTSAVGSTPYSSLIELSKWGINTSEGVSDNQRLKLLLKDVSITSKPGSSYSLVVASRGKSKRYDNTVIEPGLYPSNLLYPSTTTATTTALYPLGIEYTVQGDSKFATPGSVNNQTLYLLNDAGVGFQLETLNYRGTLIQTSRNL